MKPITRKQKRSSNKRRSDQTLKVRNPNAAGIDIGSQQHFVAVPEGRDEDPIRVFDCFTADLHQMADWLESCGVDTVVIESTGAYWIPVFEVLEERGFEVCLVNARHAKNVPGRKSDVADCRWLQELHTFGLLEPSFHPTPEIRTLRNYVRHRENLIKASSPHILRMQKALTQMNLQLHEVISDITGVTGLRIIDAILAGERDPKALAQLKDERIKCSQEVLEKSLQGHFQTELLFVLAQELQAYRFFQTLLEQCERAITECLATFEARVDVASQPLAKRKSQRNTAVRAHLYQMTGLDLTTIPGLDALTIQAIIAETGLDMTKWRTAKHFTSWATLAPNRRISGGRQLPSRSESAANRVARALKMAAQSLSRSQSALGAYYRRLRGRIGPAKANRAAARKLAILFYNSLKHRMVFADPGEGAYNERFRNRMLKGLARKAKAFGCRLVIDDATQQPMQVS
jgi:transposase